MAYELLTGDVLFPRRTDAAILFAHVDAPVPPASERRPELPPAVDAVLERGLAKDPEDRFADATSFVAALTPRSPESTCPRPPRRRRLPRPTVVPRRGRPLPWLWAW